MRQEIKVYTNANVNFRNGLKTKDEITEVVCDTFENKGELALLRVHSTNRDDSGIRLISAKPGRNPQIRAISLNPNSSEFTSLRGHTYNPLSEFMDKLCALVPELEKNKKRIFRIDEATSWPGHSKEPNYEPKDISSRANIIHRSCCGNLEVVSSAVEVDIKSRLAALVNPQATIVQEMFMGALI